MQRPVVWLAISGKVLRPGEPVGNSPDRSPAGKGLNRL